ncbi:MAG: hypothetical protein Crog4KO_12420 [Crocinitomicaceae bacterium]
MRIKQGTILPTTGIGVGYILLFIYCSTIYYLGFDVILEIPALNILFLVFIFMQFSYKDFRTDVYEGYSVVYRLFFIPFFERRHRWNYYDVFVIRVLNTSYNVAQSATGGMLSGRHTEAKLSIVGRLKTTGETKLICSGTKTQLNKVIKEHIQPSGVMVYKGAPKKGYEYHVD